jgi:CPA1 family monovalent cation:H+ antiporter
LNTFTAVACLLGLTALVALINDRWLRLQPATGLLIAAVVLTVGLRAVLLVIPDSVLIHLREFTKSFSLNETLLNGVLCLMLFRASVRMRWERLRDRRLLIVALAFGATTIAVLVTGGLVFAGLSIAGVPVDLAQALLFGALITATDPTAALAILNQLGMPPVLETVTDGESLLSDGVAVVWFTIFAVAAEGSFPSWSGPAVMMLHELVGGVALGVLGWFVMDRLLPEATEYATGLLLSLAVVACLYALATDLGVSAPIAIVVAGILTGHFTLHEVAMEVQRPLSIFWVGLDQALSAMLFVFVGIHVVLINPLSAAVISVSALVAVLAVVLSRALGVGSVIYILTSARIIRADVVGLTRLLTWACLRGGLPLALAASLPPSEWQPLLLNMTFAVVLFSVVVQGLTIGRLFTAEELTGLLGDSETPRSR